MLGLESELMALVDIVSTLYRVPADTLSDTDMVTLIDMLTEAVK